MKGHDFIPQGDDAFLDWSRNFVTLVVVNATAWEFPQSEATVLQTQLADYEAKRVVAKSGNRGKFDIAEKNTAKKKLMHTERDVTKRRLAWNPNVTSAQRKQIGVTDHDETHTPIPEPQTRPEFSFKALDLMKIRIDFHDQGSASRAIPYGDNGAVFCYTTADEPVTNYALLTQSALLTHSPWTLNLPLEAQGKRLSGALMRRNEKGERGN
jgi:hypothetical protein